MNPALHLGLLTPEPLSFGGSIYRARSIKLMECSLCLIKLLNMTQSDVL